MKNKSLKLVKWVALLIGIGAILWFVFWPLPDYMEGPGEANNLGSMVRVNHRANHRPGKLMLTSVGIAPLHPVTYLWAKLNPEYSIDSAKDVTGDQNVQAYNKVQKFYMQSAINNAIYVAYQKAHHSVRRDYHGIYVLDVVPRSRFHSSISVGDVITRVNGRHFNSAYGYQRYLSRLKRSSRVTVRFVHNGRQKCATHRLVRLPGSDRDGLGVILTDDATVSTRIPAKVNPKRIGGPSGGLMLTMQIYSQIKPANLTKGRKIAGTGTIDPHGDVGEIGGIDKKIIAAKRERATIFFAPYVKPTRSILKYEPGHVTNYQLAKRTARKYDPHMKIVPVSNFWQAVRYLERT